MFPSCFPVDEVFPFRMKMVIVDKSKQRIVHVEALGGG